MSIIKYIIKIFRHKPNRTYFLTFDGRCCTYEKKQAYRFDDYQSALKQVQKFKVGNGEKPMIEEVEE